MKLTFHPAGERGVGDHSWLSSRFSFSFADWYEPTRMGFGALRVINDDTIAPASGFGAHPHRDMEIITIVMSGTVTHEDSMGTHGTVARGEVQVMSSGTGVVHSERNLSLDEPLTLFQIWIMPNERGVVPRYAQAAYDVDAKEAVLVTPIASGEGLSIHQDAYITRVKLEASESYTYQLHHAAHGVYVFVVSGSVRVGDAHLTARDALGVEESHSIDIKGVDSAVLLLIEVPMQ